MTRSRITGALALLILSIAFMAATNTASASTTNLAAGECTIVTASLDSVDYSGVACAPLTFNGKPVTGYQIQDSTGRFQDPRVKINRRGDAKICWDARITSGDISYHRTPWYDVYGCATAVVVAP